MGVLQKICEIKAKTLKDRIIINGWHGVKEINSTVDKMRIKQAAPTSNKLEYGLEDEKLSLKRTVKSLPKSFCNC